VYQNAFEIWESLRKKYEADNDDDLVGLDGEFVTSILKKQQGGPQRMDFEIGNHEPRNVGSRCQIGKEQSRD
jgi:hypothetical protein